MAAWARRGRDRVPPRASHPRTECVVHVRAVRVPHPLAERMTVHPRVPVLPLAESGDPPRVLRATLRADAARRLEVLTPSLDATRPSDWHRFGVQFSSRQWSPSLRTRDGSSTGIRAIRIRESYSRFVPRNHPRRRTLSGPDCPDGSWLCTSTSGGPVSCLPRNVNTLEFWVVRPLIPQRSRDSAIITSRFPFRRVIAERMIPSLPWFRHVFASSM